MKRNLLSILTLLVLTALNAQATTYYVATTGSDSNPGTQAQPVQTIQKGMDLAQNGDTVLVGDGTYSGLGNRDLDPHGKNFTLRSQGGTANCIIDCEHSGRGFQFVTGETVQMVVDGFMIKDGDVHPQIEARAGGGAVMDAASPTFTNCEFLGNWVTSTAATSVGGAVFVRDGSPTFTNCRFYNSYVFSADGVAAGGAIGIQGNCYVRLGGCIFNGNQTVTGYTTFSTGGALYMPAGAWATLPDCIFTNNDAHNTYIAIGGGISILGGSQAALNNCTLSQNAAKGSLSSQAGGVYAQDPNTRLTLSN
jgi:hypothetical protein